MEEKEKKLFREKSVKKISSPEELNDYIRVTTPSVWIVLLALVLLLAGMLVWAILGRVEIHTATGAVETVRPITFLTN